MKNKDQHYYAYHHETESEYHVSQDLETKT